MPAEDISLRPATVNDLDAINRVVEAAVLTWDLPERVKRLSLSSYRYTVPDFDHLDFVVAVNAAQTILGVAAWEPADSRDTPGGLAGLLLHGLYVDPSRQRQGLGSRLLEAVLRAARDQGVAGVLVRAQEGASGFFQARGMQRLAAEDPARHYSHRFWMPV